MLLLNNKSIQSQERNLSILMQMAFERTSKEFNNPLKIPSGIHTVVIPPMECKMLLTSRRDYLYSDLDFFFFLKEKLT